MDTNEIKGNVKSLAGQVQEAVGSFAGDTQTQLNGKAREAAGKVQAQYGDKLEQLRDVTQSNPVGALLVAAGIGFLLAKVL
jgi:uncharacterized protein YjbJ (UPF0337 family)